MAREVLYCHITVDDFLERFLPNPTEPFDKSEQDTTIPLQSVKANFDNVNETACYPVVVRAFVYYHLHISN